MTANEICHLHKDNVIFNADLFVEDCKNKFQTLSFSGVGAHHLNAVAKQSIQTSMYMAWTFMIHISLHWNIVLMFLHFGFLLQNSLFGFTTAFPTISLVSYQWNY